MPPLLANMLTSLLISATVLTQDASGAENVLKIPEVLTNYSIPSTSGPFNMPPGCICAKSDATAATCQTFSCPCPCDLTAAACDANCCCDPECQIGFSEIDQQTCTKFETRKSRSTHVKMCFDNNTRLQTINPAFPIRVSETVEEAMQNLLCVEYDNSAVKGDFYISDISNVRDVQPFQEYEDRSASPLTKINDGSYTNGDRILSFYSQGSDSDAFYPGLFYIYSSSDAGYCNQLSYVEFGRNVDFSCIITIDADNLQSLCTDILSIDRFVTDIYVSKFNNLTSIMLKDSTKRHEWINPIQIESLLDPYGSSIHHIVGVPYTQWNESTKKCENSLQSIRYQIMYTPFGTIDQVVASVEARPISERDKQLSQRFAIQFTSVMDSNITKTWGNNNIVPRARSGNPGYAFQSITLGGEQKSFINQNISRIFVDTKIQGLSVMSSVDGTCNTALPEAMSVSFGVNMTVGCSLSLNLSELESFCSDSGHPDFVPYNRSNDISIRVPRWLSSDVNVVGIFGNADPLDPNQWVRIVNEELYPMTNKSMKQIWLSEKSSCLGLASEVNYRIRWTFVGSTDYPQAKILSVSRQWNFKRMLQHKLHPRNRDNFIFSSQITWTFVRSRSTAVKPPRPVLLFSVPYDVFYPFETNGSFQVTYGLGVFVASCAITIVMLLS